jgi:hypothetical protein
MSRFALPTIAALLLAGCASAPPRIAAPPPAKPLPVIVPPTPQVLDWRDAPETPGGWSYAREASGSAARFGRAGAAADFELRCDPARREISLSRPGMLPGTMTIVTSYGARSWPAGVAGGRVAIRLAAADPFLDQLAFSRGRFEVTDPGLVTLILPAWAEPARVIEDCRAS